MKLKVGTMQGQQHDIGKDQQRWTSLVLILALALTTY